MRWYFGYRNLLLNFCRRKWKTCDDFKVDVLHFIDDWWKNFSSPWYRSKHNLCIKLRILFIYFLLLRRREYRFLRKFEIKRSLCSELKWIYVLGDWILGFDSILCRTLYSKWCQLECEIIQPCLKFYFLNNQVCFIKSDLQYLSLFLTLKHLTLHTFLRLYYSSIF